MKTPLALLAVAALISSSLQADEPLLALPGKVLVDAKLDTAPGSDWKAAKGQWTAADGALRGSELEADKHGAVTRLTRELTDFILQVEVKFDGARTTSLSINAVKDHMARISLSPTNVTIRRDDNDHEGPDKAVIFHNVKAELGNEWHTVRIEMVGDTFLARMDNIIGWGSDALFTQKKTAPGMTVGGQSVLFRNFKIWEATKNPKWDELKATIKNEVQPPAVAKGKGKKGKAK